MSEALPVQRRAVEGWPSWGDCRMWIADSVVALGCGLRQCMVPGICGGGGFLGEWK